MVAAAITNHDCFKESKIYSAENILLDNGQRSATLGDEALTLCLFSNLQNTRKISL
jgi:hypothetical protein